MIPDPRGKRASAASSKASVRSSVTSQIAGSGIESRGIWRFGTFAL
ncbi:hypothetical protein ACFSTD_04535 [Novosphingobium colocasiae]